jgi:hypothetical protein
MFIRFLKLAAGLPFFVAAAIDRAVNRNEAMGWIVVRMIILTLGLVTAAAIAKYFLDPVHPYLGALAFLAVIGGWSYAFLHTGPWR